MAKKLDGNGDDELVVDEDGCRMVILGERVWKERIK